MVKRDYAALESVEFIMSAAMPEVAVFCIRVSNKMMIRMSCFLDDDEIIQALIHEFTEITIGGRLKTSGYPRKLSGSISHALTQLSLSLGEGQRQGSMVED
jgi:hypothetical protein